MLRISIKMSSKVSTVGINIEKCNKFKPQIQVDMGLSYVIDLKCFIFNFFLMSYTD